MVESWVKKTISIKKRHLEWLDRTMVSLSKFVQRKIDEELEKENKDGDS